METLSAFYRKSSKRVSRGRKVRGTLKTEYSSIRYVLRAKGEILKPDLRVRRDPKWRAIKLMQAKPDCHRRKAKTGSEVNDTSVIRGPAIKKAGR